MKLTTKIILTAALALGLAAAPAGATTYRGHTNENRTVHATVKGKKIKRLSFSLTTRCSTGMFLTDVVVAQNVKIKAGGAFKYSEKGDSSNGKATYDLVGKITKSKITGSIEEFFRGGCTDFDIKFTAKRG